jgi:hypothetical protein
MAYISIAIIIVWTETLLFLWFYTKQKPVKGNEEVINRIKDLEDQISNLKIARGFSRNG